MWDFNALIYTGIGNFPESIDKSAGKYYTFHAFGACLPNLQGRPECRFLPPLPQNAPPGRGISPKGATLAASEKLTEGWESGIRAPHHI